MSNINNQTQDLYSVELVQDLDHEAAATVTGGALVLTTDANGKGRRITFTGNNPTLGSFNNKASWYKVTGKRDWGVYAGKNFTGAPLRLGEDESGNLLAAFNDTIKSARPL